VNHRVGPGETASRFFQPAPEAGSKPSNVCDRGARVPDAAVPTVQWELCMTDQVWTDNIGSGPTIATAVHDGHHARDEVLRLFAIGDEERTREEDPFTAHWTTLAPTRVIGLRSRFEVDLNRPRDKAVYRTPEDAWGLTVWSEDLPDDVAQRSLDEYDLFYTRLKEVLAGKAETHGRFVVFDLHTYNHRRQGVDGPPADVAGNPQVNIGTGTMDRTRWAPVVDRFIGDLKDFNFPGGGLDVRENVKYGSLDSRDISRIRLLHLNRVQEVLHGRVDWRTESGTGRRYRVGAGVDRLGSAGRSRTTGNDGHVNGGSAG
jgi:N-formylglutamate deformylase